jgi:hypothetical protein
MARKKRFIVFGFALLLTGFLIAVDIALAARTVEQLARSEVYVRTASPQIWRSHVSHMAVAEKQKRHEWLNTGWPASLSARFRLRN